MDQKSAHNVNIVGPDLVGTTKSPQTTFTYADSHDHASLTSPGDMLMALPGGSCHEHGFHEYSEYCYKDHASQS